MTTTSTFKRQDPAEASHLEELEGRIVEVGKAARDAAGWHVCLDALEGALDGNTGGGDWPELNRHYKAKFGPEASTIGPPAGM